MKWLKRMVFIIQFMTRIPIPVEIEINDKDIIWSLAFSPISAILVGLFMAFGYWVGSLTTLLIIPALLAVIFEFWVTGGLHIDGLADTFDGLFCNRDRKKTLEVMRDSRIGTHGATAIMFSILLKVLVIFQLGEGPYSFEPLFILLATPIMGKVGLLTAAGLSKYARQEGGLGKSFIDGVGVLQWGVGILISLVPILLMFKMVGLLYTLIVILAAILFTKFMEGKIGGMTGDTLGAVNEICEVIFLLAFIPIYHL